MLGYAMASSDGLRYAELSWVGGMGALAGWWRRAEINEWEMRALFGWGGISGTPSCDAAGCICDGGAGAEGRQRAAKGEVEQPELGGPNRLYVKMGFGHPT